MDTTSNLVWESQDKNTTILWHRVAVTKTDIDRDTNIIGSFTFQVDSVILYGDEAKRAYASWMKYRNSTLLQPHPE